MSNHDILYTSAQRLPLHVDLQWSAPHPHPTFELAFVDLSDSDIEEADLPEAAAFFGG
ncbi:MAG TPA: hypothetical protein VII08_09230 [Myxococcales bacterium]